MSDEATTDAEGRWHIDNVPDRPGSELNLMVSHPDFVSDEHWQGFQKTAGITTAMLRGKSATLALSRGVIVQGRVTDPDGNPVKEGLIIQGDDPYFASTTCDFPIGADGRFRLPALPPRETTLTVIAPGWAPQMKRVVVEARPGTAGLPDGAGQAAPTADRRYFGQADASCPGPARRMDGQEVASQSRPSQGARLPRSRGTRTRTASTNGPGRRTPP